MLHPGPPIIDMKRKGQFFNGAVGHRHAFMLPLVLDPGLHDKGFQEAVRVGGILEQTPADSPVASPDNT